MHFSTVLLGAGLALAALAGCAEKPQTLPEARAPGYQTDRWADQLRSRTQGQTDYR